MPLDFFFQLELMLSLSAASLSSSSHAISLSQVSPLQVLMSRYIVQFVAARSHTRVNTVKGDSEAKWLQVGYMVPFSSLIFSMICLLPVLDECYFGPHSALHISECLTGISRRLIQLSPFPAFSNLTPSPWIFPRSLPMLGLICPNLRPGLRYIEPCG